MITILVWWSKWRNIILNTTIMSRLWTLDLFIRMNHWILNNLYVQVKQRLDSINHIFLKPKIKFRKFLNNILFYNWWRLNFLYESLFLQIIVYKNVSIYVVSILIIDDFENFELFAKNSNRSTLIWMLLNGRCSLFNPLHIL